MSASTVPTMNCAEPAREGDERGEVSALLNAGTKFGPYEIVAPIGAGGMGEVYRARDTRLGRDVAIKILPEHLTEKPEARQRFEREARAISSLQHPHICTLHDIGHQDGTDFLVMEFLEGETLAKRLERGALPTSDLLRIGIEVSDGLDKAHRKGILHRDLKPSNIMLTKSGAKLMDFGLAKEAGDGAAPALESLTQSIAPSAHTTPVTAQGTIVGTFQYMSPEQAKGKTVDRRTDIWAFGAVLYEMLTGEKPFSGETVTDTLAAVIKSEPDWNDLPEQTPARIRELLQRCLKKDARQRLQSIGDARIALEEYLANPNAAGGIVGQTATDESPSGGVNPPLQSAWRRILPWATAAVAIIVAALLAIGYIQRTPHPQPSIVSEIPPPAGEHFTLSGAWGPPAISPDGRNLAFAAFGSDGTERLWVRPLNSKAAYPLEGTDGARDPFWSPDSRSIGFWEGGSLDRVDISGGPPVVIAAPADLQGAAWNRDGTILFVSNGQFLRVPASGGKPESVIRLQASAKWPQFLPDGKHFLFYARMGPGNDSATYIGSLDGGAPKMLLRGSSGAVYAPPGYLLFIRQRTLMAQRFGSGSLSLIGDAATLIQNAGIDEFLLQGLFTVSDNGILAYQAGESTGHRLLWFDRSGKQIAETGSPAVFGAPKISPDGDKLAVYIRDAGTAVPDIWVYDLARGVSTRLTFSKVNMAPAWSPDGKTIVFMSTRGGKFHLYQKDADGTGEARPLAVDDDAVEATDSWSADGRYLFFNRNVRHPGSHGEIWALPLFGDRKPFPVVQNSNFDVGDAALSPDGKWLAYSSQESGQFQVYLVPFLHGGGKWEVSSGGGRWPRWRRDSGELFYLALDNKIMSAEITGQGASPAIGKPRELFQANPATDLGWAYDVSADGKKFVVVSPTAQASQSLTLVTNWPALLKKQ